MIDGIDVIKSIHQIWINATIPKIGYEASQRLLVGKMGQSPLGKGRRMDPAAYRNRNTNTENRL